MIGLAAPPPDAGFSLIEVLVALVIASFVVMAIGGLYVLTGTLRSRATEAAQVEDTLVDLQGLQSALGDDVALTIDAPRPDGFTLAPSTTRTGRPLQLRLTAAPLRIDLTSTSRTSGVDLSPFAEAAIEYLVRGADGRANWGAGPVTSGQPLAARLRLALHGRVWRPLLWIVPVAPAVDGGRP